jgi:hypothetical protein
MIEARRIRIRSDHGRLRVLRLTVDSGGCWFLAYEAEIAEGLCRLCGCNDTFGCTPPCGWVNATHTLCSRCYERMLR